MGNCLLGKKSEDSSEEPANRDSQVVFDCCLLSPNYVDENLFLSWIKGQTAMQAYNAAAAGLQQGQLARFEDQWLVHQGLEHYFQRPWLLHSQKLHPIHSEAHERLLIQTYYSFNAEVARKIMGWKLEGLKAAARLDAVSKETQIMKWSCSRQFQNFGRMLETVREAYAAEVPSTLSMRDLISGRYKLSRALANSYAQIIFCSEHRFLYKIKHDRNLDKINFVQMCRVVAAVSTSWTAPEGSLMLDHQFFKSLVATVEAIERALYDAVGERFTFERANSTAILKLEAVVDAKRRKELVEGCYKAVLQGALGIAGTLGNRSNFSRLLLATIDKICIPLQRIKATPQEVEALFAYIMQLVEAMNLSQHQEAWHRYMQCLRRVAELIMNDIGDLRESGVSFGLSPSQ